MDNLRDRLRYDPYSPSALSWIVRPGNRTNTGSPAGCMTKNGYWQVQLNKTLYLAHRVVWELLNGPVPVGMQIDHIDCNPANNLIENLRLCTPAQNLWNTRAPITNKSGVKGLRWIAKSSKWQGAIMFHGKLYTFRSFKKQDCIDWLKLKREELHGEFSKH